MGLDNKNIVVYGKPNCPYCVVVTTTLDSNNIPYTYIDVSQDVEALCKLKVSGFKTVPQIYVNDSHFGDSKSVKLLVEGD